MLGGRRRPAASSAMRRRPVRVGPTRPRHLRRWWRVRLIIFLCFFLRIRLRRFLMSEPTTADATGTEQKTS